MINSQNDKDEFLLNLSTEAQGIPLLSSAVFKNLSPVIFLIKI